MLTELPMRLTVTARHKKKQASGVIAMLLQDVVLSLPVNAYIEMWQSKQCFYRSEYSFNKGKHILCLPQPVDTILIKVECVKYVRKNETFYFAFRGKK